MANEQLTIGQDKARLSVIGKSWPNMNFDSGIGLDLSQIIFDILIDLDIPMPDIDFDDLDDIIIIPGLDIDTEIPTLEYPDPDWPDDEIPPIIDWPMPDLDWDDFIDKLEDLDIDIDILKDLSFVGLNDLELPTLVSLDMDFNIQKNELPASIVIVTPPYKMEYYDGERIDLTGMVVTAKKEDGSTWTSAKYPNGHIPLQELIIEPNVACASQSFGGIMKYGDASIPFLTHMHLVQYWNTEIDKTFDWVAGGDVYFILSGSSINAVSKSAGTYTAIKGPGVYRYGVSPIPGSHSLGYKRANRIDGNDVYESSEIVYWADNGGNPWKIVGSGPGSPSGTILYSVAETFLAGDITEYNQNITVTWLRPGDRMPLSASFVITVKPRHGNGGR